MNQAEQLKNLYVEIPGKRCGLCRRLVLYFELVGLAVYEDERLLGELTDVLPTGSNDVCGENVCREGNLSSGSKVR